MTFYNDDLSRRQAMRRLAAAAVGAGVMPSLVRELAAMTQTASAPKAPAFPHGSRPGHRTFFS